MKLVRYAVLEDTEIQTLMRLFGAMGYSDRFTLSSLNPDKVGKASNTLEMVSATQLVGRKEMSYSFLWRLSQVLNDTHNVLYERTELSFWEKCFPNRDLVPHSVLTGLVQQAWRDIADVSEISARLDEAMRTLQSDMTDEEF